MATNTQNHNKTTLAMAVGAAAGTVALWALWDWQIYVGGLLLFAAASLVGLALLGRCFNLYHQLMLDHHERIKARHEAHYAIVPRTSNVFDYTHRQVIVYTTGETPRQAVPQELPALSAGGGDLVLPDILNQHHYLLHGPTGVGKTTLAKELIKLMGPSNSIICDPHAGWNDWPSSWLVISDYQQIAATWQQTFLEMNDRYQLARRDLAAAQARPPLVLVTDELPSVLDELASLGHPIDIWLRRMAREGRKAKIVLIGITTSILVADLLQKGRGSVRQNFLQLELKQRGEVKLSYPDESTATLRWQPSNGHDEQLTSRYSVPTQIQPEDEIEQAALDLFDQGLSISAIARQLLTHDGGNQLDRIRRILQKHARTTP